MKNYEAILIFPPEETPDQRQAGLKAVEEIVKKTGGSIPQKLEIGKKLLGYPLKKFREGSIWVFDIQADPSKLQEIRTSFQLQENILKFMITVKVPVKVQPAPAKPAATTAAPQVKPIPGRPSGTSSPAAVTTR